MQAWVKYYSDDSDKFADCKSSKVVFALSNELSGKSKKAELPNNIKNNDLPDAFGTFFSDKITNLRDEVDLSQSADPQYREYNGGMFNCFRTVSCDDVKEVI